MKIVVATDSFKGCLTSLEAGNAIKKGIIKSCPKAEVKVFPISDGGEGLYESLKQYYNTETVEVEVTGPEFVKVNASYGLNRGKNLAVMEMASSAGLPLVKSEKNVKTATTYGVGEMINDALNKGAREFIIGIGGSATNDGGIGMLSALGFRFMDVNGKTVSPNAFGLKDIVSIDISESDRRLKNCSFTVACDVDIPLCGDNGCSILFGPQKGASKKDIFEMDEWLKNFAKLTKLVFPDSDKDIPGSGAAGGMGFALKSYLSASLKPGIDIVISCMGLETEIMNADYVCTGEGRIDDQTSKGKVISGVLRVAKKFKKPVVAFCGSLKDNVNIEGLERICQITKKDMTLEEAMKPDTASRNLATMASSIFNKT